jgi:hypothetical protein
VRDGVYEGLGLGLGEKGGDVRKISPGSEVRCRWYLVLRDVGWVKTNSIDRSIEEKWGRGMEDMERLERSEKRALFMGCVEFCFWSTLGLVFCCARDSRGLFGAYLVRNGMIVYSCTDLSPTVLE